MTNERLLKLAKKMQPGKVYRRKDLEKYSSSIDRDLSKLIGEKLIGKAGAGLYYKSRTSPLGLIPPPNKSLIRSFLNDDRYLIISFADYNKLGLGLSQLYNFYLVYNYKRHVQANLGGQKIYFKRVSNFPQRLSKEFLIVDLLNNIDLLADDSSNIIEKIKNKLNEFKKTKLQNIANIYGKIRTKNIINSLVKQNNG